MNGHVSWESRDGRTIVRYRCFTNFTIVGASERNCRSGVWVPRAPPLCVATQSRGGRMNNLNMSVCMCVGVCVQCDPYSVCTTCVGTALTIICWTCAPAIFLVTANPALDFEGHFTTAVSRGRCNSVLVPPA